MKRRTALLFGLTGALLPGPAAFAAQTFPGRPVGMIVPFAPAGTPAATVDRLFRDIRQAVAVPEPRARIAEQGFELVTNSPRAFAAQARREVEAAAKIIHSAGLRVE